MATLYNEIDPYAADWLRNLVRKGLIPDGEVSTVSIVDLRPSDLSGFDQFHAFAGIGGWPLALRMAGWPDDRKIWTGSCPCQPFSVAGKRKGVDDERHLWPVFFELIRECRPDVVMGEQVASKDGLAWLDTVLADLETATYAAGAVDCCAAGLGAPHIRQRLWWGGYRLDGGQPHRVADDNGRRRGLDGEARLHDRGQRRDDAHRRGETGGMGLAERIGAGRDARAGVGAEGGPRLRAECDGARSSGPVGRLADADRHEPGEGRGDFGEVRGVSETQCQSKHGPVVSRRGCADGRMADTELPEESRQRHVGGPSLREQETVGLARGRMADELGTDPGRAGMLRGQDAPSGGILAHSGGEGLDLVERHGRVAREEGGDDLRQASFGNGGPPDEHLDPGPTNGFWSNPDWLFCRDGRWRPVESGTFPLADGVPGRVGRLRAYGNAISPPVAAEVIAAFMECLP